MTILYGSMSSQFFTLSALKYFLKNPILSNTLFMPIIALAKPTRITKWEAIAEHLLWP